MNIEQQFAHFWKSRWLLFGCSLSAVHCNFRCVGACLTDSAAFIFSCQNTIALPGWPAIVAWQLAWSIFGFIFELFFFSIVFSGQVVFIRGTLQSAAHCFTVPLLHCSTVPLSNCLTHIPNEKSIEKQRGACSRTGGHMQGTEITSRSPDNAICTKHAIRHV